MDIVHGAGVRRCSRLVGVQRIVQNNSNVKSEPKYLAYEESSIRAFNFFFFFCRSLGFLGFFSSLLLFLRVGSCRLRSALVYVLCSANMYAVKGQLCCPPRPLSARNVVSTWLCNARIRYPAWAWTQIYIPKRYHKLTFLSMTDTYVHTYVHMYIARINPSFIALC